MSDATLPRFAKTGGSQKFATQKGGVDGLSISKEGSGVSAFFKTLKKKLSKQESLSPKSASQTTKFTPEDKAYFIKATTQRSMGRKMDSSTASDCATLGDLDGLMRLLNLGGDVEDMDSDGNTALHHASEAGFVEIVDLLGERGADLNAKNVEGETPLHLAAQQGHGNVVQSMLVRGANPNAKTKDGWTALHEAAMKGTVQVAQLLLDYRADPAMCTSEGDTPLHKAARWNHIGITLLLLANGADATARDKLGRTPGERTNNAEVLQLLKEHADEGAQPRLHSQGSHAHKGADFLDSDRESQQGASSASGISSVDCSDTDNRWGIEEQSEFYQTQWALFVSNKDAERKISYSDVPWPGASMNASAILEVVLCGTRTQEERKRRLRTELLRWHPDKFQALFGNNLRPDDANQIMAKVKEISQAINTAAQQK